MGKFEKNIDNKTVEGFGDEWERFDQAPLSEQESFARFKEYFKVFPWEILPAKPVGFDLGCGSGRWAKYVAPRVEKLYCIDPSSAIKVAKKNLSNFDNCYYYKEDIDSMSIEDNSMDFGYSLGVLHHIPDTLEGIRKSVKKLKPGMPFLLYLYYSFDNKPKWFKFVWKVSNYLRIYISKRSFKTRFFLSQLIAFFIYWPVTRLSKIIEKTGFRVENFPLSYYRNYSFYSMRTDALDRFGTRLENRFTKDEIEAMMIDAGLNDIVFSDSTPYWCAVGIKKKAS